MKKNTFGEQSLKLHKKLKGKIEVVPKIKVKDKKDLSLAYTPGVAAVSKWVAGNKEAMWTHTIKANTVAVVTDGSAVLGLGNIGPEGGMPVMEGKALLFKELAGVDAFPICLATQDEEEIVRTVKNIAVGFGGINLEDICAPRCFVIEERLKKELDIPVFHDDQHGTAIVALTALINALKLAKKNIGQIKMVINGAGAAAMACANLFMRAGISGKNILMLDQTGIIFEGRKESMNEYKEKMAALTNPGKIKGGLSEALNGADVFVGVSAGNVLTGQMVEKMADKPIVFAMANPDPEISYEEAKKAKIFIFGTGRSDYPNQINNALAFPGIFRGALDARAKAITDEMKLSAAYAIAKLVPKMELKTDNIIPSALDKRVAKAVASAVKKASGKA
ncbi:NADP-dependent malic enzyme [Candidatus Parcubacteria bacterium]|nr:MAG: NADP-dependent malic enzyme [Candidatus Parcubacteria bacterium]